MILRSRWLNRGIDPGRSTKRLLVLMVGVPMICIIWTVDKIWLWLWLEVMICTIRTYGYRDTANCLADFLVLSGTLTMGRCRPTRMTPLIWGPQRSRNTKHVRFQNHYFSIFLLYDFCAWLKTWSFMIFLMEELWDHGSCLFSQFPNVRNAHFPGHGVVIHGTFGMDF